MTNTIAPPPSTAQVITELEKFISWEPEGSPRAPAMRAAVAALRRLSPPRDAEDMPEFQAHGYRIDSHAPSHELRISFFRKRDQGGLLGYLILSSPEVYELGTALIKGYDKIEGIK